MPEPHNHADFLRLVVAEFPELLTEFDAADFPYLQMHVFARHVQSAKKRADWATYKRCMKLTHELWRRPDHDLLNELNVAFLEHIDFDGPNGPEAWRLLSPELQDGWRVMKAANERLADLPTKRKKRK